MSDEKRPEVGTICWRDLTVGDAGRIRDFYNSVVGWKAEPVDMGGYSDFNMIAPATGGLCVIRDPAGAVCALYRPPRAGR